VTAPSGVPVSEAEVVWDAATAPVRSDANGRFRLPHEATPRELLIRHPLFTDKRVPVAVAGEALNIVLEPAPVFSEAVLVMDRRLTEDAVPRGTAATSEGPNDGPAPPATVLDVIDDIAGVAENGQGGIFQNYSVRGLSRQRVLTLVQGMRVVGERRAGVSASFIDPLLLDSVSVVRGPASIAYGSGALGGVVEVFPRVLSSGEAAASYASQGNGTAVSGGWGGSGWSLAAAGREKGDSEDPTGATIDDSFKQASATLRKTWTKGGVEYDVLAIPTAGRDIGKASTDNPTRVVTYPEENHLMLRFAAKSPAGWRVRTFVHPNELVTRTESSGSITSEVTNDAFDMGADAQWSFAPEKGPRTRVGVDWFGRRSVDAVETGNTPGRTLDAAQEDEPSVFGMFEWETRRVTAQAGVRVAWNRQSNSGPAVSAFGWNGFGGLVVPLPRRFELSFQLASGSRFPSLSERFFSGSTGRGSVLGNAGLTSEHALSAEAGFHWTGQRATVAAYAFRVRVDGFIERVEVQPDVFSFVNLREGTIDGAELEAYVQATRELRLTLAAAVMNGEDDSGASLEDVPPQRATLGVDWTRGIFDFRVEGQWRAAKDDPGAGEKAIPAVSLLSASVAFALPRGLALFLSGSNLLNEAYFSSADAKVPLSPGRGFEIGLRWRFGPAS
jgi:iron complex outermembrane receptor protein